MRKGLPRRMHELRAAAAELQKLGWTLTSISLTAEDNGEHGMLPYGSITLRYDPLKPTDVI
jgi:hypothetical protein